MLAELALFSVLFTDGQRIGVRDLTLAWKLPGRALLLGMPLTFLVTGVLAVVVAGLPWPEALLVAAVLAPTDPVFAAAIVGREEVPGRMRHLLNVESGLNDGLALPVVLVLLGRSGRPRSRVRLARHRAAAGCSGRSRRRWRGSGRRASRRWSMA